MAATQDPRFERLLDLAIRCHNRTEALQAFCPFPTDIASQPSTPFAIPAADLLAEETRFGDDDPEAEFREAFVAAGPIATWRQTYSDDDLPGFNDRFGCYCLIGEGGPYRSGHMAAYVVYMPPGLWYAWHHHPGEELYLVLAGEGEFFKAGEASQRLTAGDAAIHGSNQPHALRTHDQPLLCYVIWRNGFGIKPVLTPEHLVSDPLGIPHIAN